MIKRTRLAPIVAIALFGGILTSLAYVSSPTSEIDLSGIILCLSGNEPSSSVLDLLSLSTMYLPLYVFCAFSGTNLYRHFCTASVYIFSRQPKRINWYVHELVSLLMTVLVYQIVFIVAALWMTSLKLHIDIDRSGIILLVYYLAIQSLWTCSLSLMINILSIWFGSDLGYAFGIGLKMVLITLLAVQDLLAINPVSRLVFGWHKSENEILGVVLDNTEYALDIHFSLGYMIVICVFLLVGCGLVVVRHDLLVSNKETGGV